MAKHEVSGNKIIVRLGEIKYTASVRFNNNDKIVLNNEIDLDFFGNTERDMPVQLLMETAYWNEHGQDILEEIEMSASSIDSEEFANVLAGMVK